MLLAVLITASAYAQTGQQEPTVKPRPEQPENQAVRQQNNALTGAIPVIPGINDIQGPNTGESRIAREVRHELLMLPYYSLFDDLRYKVTDNTVELLGNVLNGSLKPEAEKAVKKIEGVEKVINNIEVLPPSPMDDRLRQRVARAVFGMDGLSRYGWEAAPSIHIIVKNGRVTLLGVVDNQADKNMANVAASGVPGIFSVDNQLYVVTRK